MKQCLCIFLAGLMLLSMTGCHSPEPGGVTFYYCRESDNYQFFKEDGVIHGETRDIMGHRNDLRYMVSLYLAGPMEEGLSTPFTKATRLVSAEIADRQILIELSGHNKILSDSEFSLGCACLALTCMEFMDCDSVTILSGERSVTMHADSILMYDTLPQQETTGG